ncbi:MAG: aminotransferase class V-fold PLP-dependent enzyme [Vicinamibacterales bacterium]
MQRSYAAFLATYPEYEHTRSLDALRASEYQRLDANRHVYVDFTGAGLYGESQVRRHLEQLESQVYGNPHSGSPASDVTTQLVERARRRVLEFFGASSRDFTAIFTANATAALKLVGEAYPFAPGGRCLLTFDNHNSVNGIREFARRGGAAVAYAPLTTPDLGIDRVELDRLLEARPESEAPRLFAFPAQSNFSGVRHSLEIIRLARDRGWDVLLDAAAFVPTTRLDLDALQPDFAAVSFYKMFGYPTGVGCLIARRTALARLRRPWFAGGTINFATVQGRAHHLSPGEAGFEDGTLNFLSIPAVTIGLDWLDAAGLDVISTRVRCLTGWLLSELLAFRHSNGRPLVRIYGPATTATRGATVTFNLYDPEGHLLDYRRVEELAAAEGISLRTGCFCNPGAGEAAEGLTEGDMLAGAADADISLPRFRQLIEHRAGKSAGAIRVSFGLVSNFLDACRVRDCIGRFKDETRLTIGEVSFDIESCRVIRDGS